MAAEAREINIGFVARMTRSRPWLRLKLAASLDGKTALQNGASQWLTGAAARQDGHRWRARACAILTGIGTVRHDDPQLNVRGVDLLTSAFHESRARDSQIAPLSHAGEGPGVRGTVTTSVVAGDFSSDVRLRQPLKVLVDNRLELLLDARVLCDGHVLVLCLLHI